MARIAPTTIPAMAPGEMLDDVVCVGDEEGELVVVDDGVELAVDDGDVLLRQPALLEGATSSVAEDPPELPRASVTEKMMVVPAATLAVHVKLVPVEGVCRRKTSPPGMNP